MSNILENLKKIEKALDLSFQSDSTLYISKEDSNQIYKYLHENNAKKILQKAKILKNGHEVVAKVVLENSYLLTDSKVFKDLREIFLEVDSNYADQITFS